MGTDHGLRYELAGVLGSPRVLGVVARAHPAARVVPLAVADLALLPLVRELAAEVTPAALCSLGSARLPGGTPAAARRRAELLTGPESGFSVLTPGMVALIEAGSSEGPLAYVEADYLGREGSQAAALWRSGHLAGGPWLLGRREAFSAESAPISVVLRELGVVAAARSDEFVVAGLGRCRRTRDWGAAPQQPDHDVGRRTDADDPHDEDPPPMTSSATPAAQPPTVPSLVLPDGHVATNPEFDEVVTRLGAAS